jgi:hypothetical protein
MVIDVNRQRRTFLHRVVGAAALRADVYEEVEADHGATLQAIAVVVMGSVAAGIGARGFGGGEIGDVMFFTAVALAAWAAWALLTYQIGTRILPEGKTRADLGQLLRTIGFASAPGLVRVVGIVPAISTAAFVVAWVWMLLAMIVAVRQALDYSSTRRAIAVCALGWVLAGAFAIGIGLLFGPEVA